MAESLTQAAVLQALPVHAATRFPVTYEGGATPWGRRR